MHLGVHNLTDNSEEGRLVVRASRTIVHENFNSANLDNDIGIIKLPLSVEASSIFFFTKMKAMKIILCNLDIAPIALPSRSFAEQNTFENYTARIFGWGISRNGTL